ncbi:hypothetical protein [Nocardia jejuensis]|uniref:hypothetical protein n=1 Tax=Nocardia jejuensis TaxID=328049 RepID=UPI00082FE9DD|nr:hypothetical protein [Nocardia jejuensis]
MILRQGQIWNVESHLTGHSGRVVIVDSDLMARSRQRIAAAPVRPSREVPDALQLLTAALPNGDTVAVYDLVLTPKNTLTSHVGDLSPEALEQVRVALRARFEL